MAKQTTQIVVNVENVSVKVIGHSFRRTATFCQYNNEMDIAMEDLREMVEIGESSPFSFNRMSP